MTRPLRYVASAVCFAAALSLACAAPAIAKDPSPGASTAKKAEGSKRYKRHSANAAAATPSRSGWTGPDPTRGGAAEYMRQMQREGRCFVDEGYGRYSACSNE